MCFLGVLGILMMILENELTFNRIDHKDTTFSLLLKATITFTTILLVGLVFYYHRIDISLYSVDNSIDDWRIVLTPVKIFSILFEALICAIHPIPGHFLVEWSSQHVKINDANGNFINPYRSGSPSSLNGTSTTTAATTGAGDAPQSYVPIDVMLSLPSKSSDLRIELEHLSTSSLPSVFSSVPGLPFDHASFTLGSRCVIAVARLPQSSFISFSLHYQILHSRTTGTLSHDILHHHVLHCQLVDACVRFQCENRTHVISRLDMVIHYFIYNNR